MISMVPRAGPRRDLFEGEFLSGWQLPRASDSLKATPMKMRSFVLARPRKQAAALDGIC